MNDREPPVCSCVVAIPQSLPKLKDHINHITWGCVENTVGLDIEETPNFESFNWLHNLNVVWDSLLKSAFGHVKKEVLVLEFRNNVGDLISTITLTGLQLIHHRCAVHKNSLSHVFHNVVIKYEKIEVKS